MPSDALIIDMSVDEVVARRRVSTIRRAITSSRVSATSLPNLPSEVARTASIAFTQATLPYLLALGEPAWPAPSRPSPPCIAGRCTWTVR